MDVPLMQLGFHPQTHQFIVQYHDSVPGTLSRAGFVFQATFPIPPDPYTLSHIPHSTQDYSSEEVMKERLTLAMTEGAEAFHLS